MTRTTHTIVWCAVSHHRSALFSFMMTFVVSGCAAQTEDACLDALDLQCVPAYAPSYEAIYNNLLSKSCGAPGTGSVCHGARGLKGGLDLSDLSRSYDSLLGLSDGAKRVLPGDPACSTLVARLESSDPMMRMPVGSAQLSLGERCAVRKWIAEGAAR